MKKLMVLVTSIIVMMAFGGCFESSSGAGMPNVEGNWNVTFITPSKTTHGAVDTGTSKVKMPKPDTNGKFIVETTVDPSEGTPPTLFGKVSAGSKEIELSYEVDGTGNIATQTKVVSVLVKYIVTYKGELNNNDTEILNGRVSQKIVKEYDKTGLTEADIKVIETSGSPEVSDEERSLETWKAKKI